MRNSEIFVILHSAPCDNNYLLSTFNKLIIIIREAEAITSTYQVTAIEDLDILIFDAIIKLRNNKK